MKSGLTVIHPSSMIQSTSHNDPAAQAKALASAGAAAPLHAPAKRDKFSSAGIDQLKALLRSEPEVRPEVVERGRALATDPAYPSSAIIGRISAQILASPDPASDAS